MRNNRAIRSIATLILMSLLSELFYVPIALAGTSGPAQADFSRFDPAGSIEMVDPFTGAFKYNLPLLNVPGPNGSGYPISLSYHSNSSPEEDASWVGYGWSLNPGSIVRMKNGFADDLNGEEVTYHNQTEPSTTWTAGVSLGGEIRDITLGLGGVVTLSHNNYKGWGMSEGLFTSVRGIGSLGLNAGEDGKLSFSVRVNPLTSINKIGHFADQNELAQIPTCPGLTMLGNTYALNQPVSRPTTSPAYSGYSWSLSPGVQGSLGFISGAQAGISGSTTVVENIAQQKKNAYGYMYSANASEEDVMDYSVEKSKPYIMDNVKFLSIPFGANDQFVATGEGIGGSFHLHQRRVGQFRPNKQTSSMDMHSLVAELIFPDPPVAPPVGPPPPTGDYGLSGSASVSGTMTTEVGEWADPSNGDYHFENEDRTDGDGEPYFFRYNNDLGGTIDYNSSDEPAAQWETGHYFQAILAPVMNKGRREGRSQYIGYHTNEEMMQTNSSGPGSVYYKAYNQDRDISGSRSLVDRANNFSGLKGFFLQKKKAAFDKSIGEFALNGGNGNQYVYGLPVYSRNESSSHLHISGSVYSPGHMYQYAPGSSDPTEQNVGEEHPTPYASTYLLTEVTTPDYVDRTNDGPTSDDFGGYTKFNYTRAYGNANKLDDDNSGQWYKWRSPYRGYQFHHNTLSETRDDIASVNRGEKEAYYLQSIETKTHIAYFVTNLTNFTTSNGKQIHGSLTKRHDAFQAADEATARQAPGSNDYPGSSDENKMQYLEQIQLYAKDAQGRPVKLLQTIHLQYDYSLMPNQLNSSPKSGGGRYGKLTLRRVWKESEGVINDRISPYEFDYQYPGISYPAPYNNTNSSSPYAAYGQNPDYNAENIDCWGMYQANAGARYLADKPWINQNPTGADLFDPAVWQLKVIRTPSGGQIHVQYEPNDYAYVQDRPAMAMVTLTPVISQDNGAALSGSNFTGASGLSVSPNKYYLNISSDLGNNADLNALRQEIDRRFIQGKEKMFFKFLYQIGTEACNTEYMTGYANVTNSGVDGDGLYVQIGDISGGAKLKDKPLQVAVDFVHANNRLALSNHECVTTNPPGFPGGDKNVDVVNNMGGLLAGGTGPFTRVGPQNIPILQVAGSFLRVPVLYGKKGGGVRVRRILHYNPAGSLENSGDDGALYGAEYLYETFESGRKISSGVATNEPAAIREENTLVKMIDDADPDIANRIVAGEETVQYEGPLGESLLPGPSIGYSRVIVQNIHQGATTPGYEIYEYHTVKDHPTVTVKKTGINQQIENSSPIVALFQWSEETVSATQGYSFLLSDMHGRMKGYYKYGGVYNRNATTLFLAAGNNPPAIAGNPIASQEVEYFSPDEYVPFMSAPDRPFRLQKLGRETEVFMEGKSINDVVDDQPIPFSGVIKAPFPWFDGSLFTYSYYKGDELKTHVTSKMIHYPVVVKSVTSGSDGIYQKVENVAFDPNTGSPVVTRTTDGYDQLALAGSSTIHDGSVYSYRVPAVDYHSDMGQQAKNERLVIKSIATVPDSSWKWTYPYIGIHASGSTHTAGGSSNGQLLFSLDLPSPTATDIADAHGKLYELQQTLCPGDLIELKNVTYETDNTGVAPVTIQHIVSKGIFYLGTQYTNTTNPQVGYNLLDPYYGSASTSAPIGDVNVVEVIHSGKENALGANSGTLALYSKKQEMDAALGYAQVLQTREQYADKLNGWLDQGSWGESLLTDQTLTWQHTDNSTSSVFDFVNALGMPYGSLPNPLPSPLPSYLYADIYGTTHVRYGFNLTRSGPPGTVTIGWYDNLINDWYTTPTIPAKTYKQTLTYTGKERFGINDDGQLVYYTFINGQASATNLDFKFRNCTGVCSSFPADPLRVNALKVGSGGYENVMSAQIQSYSDNWSYDFGSINNSLYNPYELGQRGRWRAFESYAYKTDALTFGSHDAAPGSGSRGNERNYKNAGAFTLPDPINWDGPNSNGWIKTGTVAQYSYNGEAIQSYNILRTPSATRFSHGNVVPAIASQNAEYSTIHFQSFEDGSITGADNTTAHSGKYSYQINNTTYSYPLGIAANDSVRKYGASLRFWAKPGSGITDAQISTLTTPLAQTLSVNLSVASASIGTYTAKKIARTGDWTLFEVVVPANSVTAAAGTSPALQVTFKTSGCSYNIDDLRMQPLQAQSTCYVYERNTLRLLTVFDDQHFGLTYQYDREGRLLRKIKETIGGNKTVQEAITHIPELVARDSYHPVGGASGLIQNTGNSKSDWRAYPLQQGNQDFQSPAVNGKFDLLNLDLSPDKKSLKIFGSDSLAVPHLNPGKVSAPALDSAKIGVPQRIQNIQKMQNLPKLDSLKTPKPDMLLNKRQKEQLDSLKAAKQTLDTLRKK